MADPTRTRHCVSSLSRNRTGLCLLLLVLATRAGRSRDDVELEMVLKQMDSVGRTFHSFAAQFTQKKFTAVLKEFDEPETGEFFYERAKDGSALLRQEVEKPGKRILTIKGSIATIFQPKIKQAQIINLGKNKDKAEYLAIGLGQSPGKLRESFDLKYVGTETVDKAPCSVILLKPKSSAAAAYFSAITLWIKKANGIPIQQKLEEPNGNYLLVNFSAEKLNASIPESKFEQNLPPGVDIQRFQ